jgi:flagellar biosynthesis/type III secretory pathway protein FliH
VKTVYERAEETGELPASTEPAEPVPEPSLDPHPDRMKLLEQTSPEPDQKRAEHAGRRNKRPRPQTFKNETEIARKKKEEAEARRKAREEAERERERKIAERERMRKAMAKARGGPDGKRKLGRESTVLLEKVKRLVGNV